MEAGSLFTGIGGLDLGLERAGIQIKWQCENHPYCRLVLHSRWPKTTLFTDIKYVQQNDFCKSINLLVGGFPCQPVSLAGHRNGNNDYRWLWPEFKRCISELQPTYVLIENVEGLRTNGLQEILSDLASLGYDAEWDCLPAAIVGAPHIRKRYFIVAYPKGYVRSDEPAILNTKAFFEWAKTYIVSDVTFSRLPTSSSHRLPSSERYVANTDRKIRGYGWWSIEPRMARMVYGVSYRLDRHKTLGNAVIPQLAEFVGSSLIKFEKSRSERAESAKA